MNIFRNMILGAVALGALAVATPAQARSHHYYGHSGGHYYGHSYGHYYHHGPYVYGGVYSRPYYNTYDPYYYSYSRPYPYYYSDGPVISLGFGGHQYWHGGHWSHHHHH